ncbi:MAG: hypothetical protein ACRDJE_19500 [Dehalococcoidia bacterium]
MTTEEKNVFVFKDQAGEYYLLPQETLKQGRVPEEHKAELEQIMAEAAAQDGADQDTQGFFFFFILPVIVNPVTVVGGVAGYFGTRLLTD